MGIICLLLTLYLFVLLARVIVSFVQAYGRVPYSGPLRRVIDILYALTEPLLRPIRGLLPPVRMGGIGLDLSILILSIAIGIFRNIACTS